MPSTRLTSQKWLIAGLDALAEQGPQSLAAEPLARQLGTTKGSFYWHFKDVPTFQAEVIDRWHKQTLTAIEAQRGKDIAPDKALRQFGRARLQDRAEAAMRIWASGNTRVAAVLAQTDAARLMYVTELLRQLGLGNPDFARALMAALAGLPQVIPADPDGQIAAYDTLVDTVLALS